MSVPVELLAEEFGSASVDTIAYKGLAVQAVRQVDNPEVCRIQTRRFILAVLQQRATDPSFIDPDVAWMAARCANCGACGAAA